MVSEDLGDYDGVNRALEGVLSYCGLAPYVFGRNLVVSTTKNVRKQKPIPEAMGLTTNARAELEDFLAPYVHALSELTGSRNFSEIWGYVRDE